MRYAVYIRATAMSDWVLGCQDKSIDWATGYFEGWLESRAWQDTFGQAILLPHVEDTDLAYELPADHLIEKRYTPVKD